MDSQGRSRLIIGGLTLVAVILVISLLISQQRAALPLEVESPLADEAVEGTPTAGGQSPLDLPGPESPLARPGDAIDASSSVTPSVEATATVAVAEGTTTSSETEAISETETISATLPVTDADVSTMEPLTVSARSTVTVTLAPPLPRLFGFEVIATYPHDPQAYTQGLQYVDGVLYEGTGIYGQSSLRRVDLESGTVEQQIDLDAQYFGEGIYVLEDRIYQLTWQSNVAFLYDREDFALLEEFNYPTEGWGLAYDGEDLLMSDGSSTIFRRDPTTFAEVGRFVVNERGDPVNLLNELEYINGELWANIWQSDEIVIINPEDGQVSGRIDLTGLLPEEDAAGAEVLNGIAYDEEGDRIFVTGKYWPTLFEIELVPR